MHGSEPFLSDLGLVPVATGEKDTSLHLYRRNSCHQERLQHDLQRLRNQQERMLRKANREIIDLNLEQKKRKETLNHPRRRSECLGVPRRKSDSDDSDHHQFKRFHTPGLSSQSGIHRNVSNSPLSSSPSTTSSFPRRRASISTPTSLPPLPHGTTKPDTSSSSPTELSKSFEHLHSSSSSTVSTQSSSSIQELYMDSKSRKDFTRLKKVSERWRNAAQQGASVERTGKPLIPTSSFTSSSTSNDHEVRKNSKVFDRLSKDARTSALSSDNFLKVLKNKYKSRDAPSKT